MFAPEGIYADEGGKLLRNLMYAKKNPPVKTADLNGWISKYS